MLRRQRTITNPATLITWRNNLQLFSTMDITLVGMVRILIDQAVLGTTTLIDDPTPGDIFWPSQQIYDAANEVVVDYWAQVGRQMVPVELTSATFSVGTGSDIVAYDTTTIMIPTYITLNTSIANQSVNQKYFITDMTKLEQWSKVWRSDQAERPKWFVLWDAFHLRVFPHPDATYVFTLFGVPWPDEITASNEDIDGDMLFRLAIAYRTAANLLEATRPDTADMYLREAEELLARYRIRIRNQQAGTDINRMKPGGNGRGTDRTIAAYKGVIGIGRRLS